jgi:4-hydroxy-2-oxoglutarate aldolase
MKLQGILPPVPTPFINDEIAVEKLKENISKWNMTGLSGYLILGSNGEAVMLNEAEKRNILEAARTVIPKDKIMMAGAGAESTRETIRYVKMAAEAGADCVLVITPSFFKTAVTQEALYQHYTSIADASPVPVLLYSVPQFTGVSLQAATVARLAEHPNIVGMKDSSGDMTLFADLVAFTPKTFSIFVGSAPVLLPALSLGSVGGILAVANVIPEACVRLYQLFKENKIDQTRQAQFNINPLSHAVTAKYGVAGLKAAMELAGYYGGEPRLPLLRVNDPAKMEMHTFIQMALS